MRGWFEIIQGGITAPTGFLASAVFCDIKRLGTGKGSNRKKKKDLALIVSETPATAAGLFTTNQVCAAPVKVCLDHLAKPVARAVVVNSGNANACTGPQGKRDALAMAAATARSVNALAPKPWRPISPREVLVASTGRIGVALPMTNVRKGITAAAADLSHSSLNAHQAAEAIMTSDTHPKELALELVIGKKTIRLGGLCKGAGMIQPGMSRNAKRPPARPLHATMLAFLTTDAAVEAGSLQIALNEAVAHSFNRITVDGDMSTNDTVLLLANGAAGNPALKKGSSSFKIFQEALNEITLRLAKMIVRDGEGASRFVTVRVDGARNFDEADAAARSVANSILVKTSWCGGDPNWGRILDAIGYSSALVTEEKVDVAYSRPGSKQWLYSLRKGRPTTTAFKTLCALVAEKEFDLHIHLNSGKAAAVIYTADLTEEYVDFNKGDVTDPAALGG